MMKLIIGIILGALLVVFAVQNTEIVQVHFLAWTISTPRVIMLLVVLVVAFFVGWMTKGVRERKKDRQENREAEQKA